MPRKWPLDAISQKIIVDLIIYRRLEFGGDGTDRGCAMVKSQRAADRGGGWRTVKCVGVGPDSGPSGPRPRVRVPYDVKV